MKILYHADGNYTESVSGNSFSLHGSAAMSVGYGGKFGSCAGFTSSASQDRRMYTPLSTTYDVAGGNFTLDFWFMMTNASHNVMPFWINTVTNTGDHTTADMYVQFYNYGIYLGGASVGATNFQFLSSYFTLNAWHHIALERIGENMHIYFNGVRRVTRTLSGVHTAGPKSFALGTLLMYSQASYYIDEVRLTTETPYGGVDFTPPTAPYTL